MEERLRIVEEFLAGGKSFVQASKEAGIGETTLRRWVSHYRAEGVEGLRSVQGNRCYSKELKMAVVQDFLRGDQTINEIRERYKLRTNRQIHSWVKIYEEYGEIRRRGRIPTGVARSIKWRKASNEERVAVVKECIASGNDYVAMAVKYQLAYAQVYKWVAKYRAAGEEALTGQRKKARANILSKAEEAHLPARTVVNLIHQRYGTGRELAWRILEDEYNIKKGSGYVMDLPEIREYERSVLAALEKAQADQNDSEKECFEK